MRTPRALVMYYTLFILHIFASKRNDTLASEWSIFSQKNDYHFFPCRGEPVHTYISGSRCVWWQKTTNRQTQGRTTVTFAVHLLQELMTHGPY